MKHQATSFLPLLKVSLVSGGWQYNSRCKLQRPSKDSQLIFMGT